MLRELMEHHEVHPSFLEVPLSFSYRDTDEEQSFCVPWTVREDESSIRMYANEVAQEFSLISRRGVLHFPVRRTQRPSKRAVGHSSSWRISKV